ncbi:Protein tyrosine phosphatase domain-containing protein 1 [Halotydeus destructor]|nr:Protein tyrosine phosphatase domain-containing protein 1 [Halotydeus destructor]
MSVTQGSSKMKTSSDLESVLPPMASPKKHNNASLPTANYSALSERIRKSTPSDLQCAFLCGGRRCKYESPASWSSHELSLPGFYSHWVTEDIVAMSRPNAETMKQFNLIKTFKESKTRSPGLLKMASSESSTSLEQSKEDENSMTVDFQLTGADSFTKYFYSALKYPSGQPSGGIMGLATRPNSNMTIMSGFTSPDTILTELSCGSGSSRRVNTADSGKRVSTNVQSSVDSNAHLHRDNAKALPYIVHSKSSSSAQPSPSSSSATLVDLTPSHTASTSGPSPPLPTPASSSSSSSSSFHHHHHLPSQFAFNSLPPVEELSDTSSSILGDLSDLHGPLRQIGIVGLDTPKRSASNGSATPGQFPFLEPLPLSGHLDRDTGTLLRSGSNSPSDSLSSLIEKTLGYRIVHYEQADHQADRQSDTSDTYSQFEEILARTGLVPQDMYQDFDQRSLEGHQPLAMFCEPFDHQVETTLDPVSVVTSLLVDYTQLSPEFGKLLTQYQGTRYTFEYLLRFIARLRPEAEMFELLLGRLVSSLAQQIVKINGNPVIENPNWTQMRKGTTGRVLLFLNGIYSLLQTN